MTYQKPRVNEAVVDLEGLVCTSGFKTLQVDQLRNVNADNTDNEQLYFEF